LKAASHGDNKTVNKGIQRFFSEVPGTYELVNHVITLGLDSLWRRRAVSTALEHQKPGGRCLDVCSGTGQMARLLFNRGRGDAAVVAADFSLPMLSVARGKSAKERILFSGGDALHLPFADQTFDVVTIGFATRNLCAVDSQLLEAFREFHRVLRPGGCFINVETSQPPASLIKKLFHLYVGLTVRPVGQLISRSTHSYAYLANSIRRFYDADSLAERLRTAGFAQVTYRRHLFGAVALHRALK
jgi:demethylmenaquinone methyltransferase/2-methoxy-6-polyprenyl-1,4-benzoquinol methylase